MCLIKTKSFFLSLGLVVVLTCSSALAAPANQLSQLKTLIAQQDYQQAYTLSKQLLAKYESNPEFDYLYAIAAEQTQHADEAYFALERVLIKQPNNYSARLALAKAHLALREFPTAQKQLRILAKQKLTPDLRQQLEQLLTQASPAKTTSSLKTFARIATSVGYDSNASGATADEYINTIKGPLEIPTNNRQIASAFQDIQFNTGFTQQLDNQQSWYGRAGMLVRNNFKAHNYDITRMNLAGGYRLDLGRSHLHLPLRIQHLWLDDRNFVTVYSAGGEALYDVVPNQQVGVFGEYDRILYNQGSATVRNSHLYIAGVTTRHLLTKLKTQLITKLYYQRQLPSSDTAGAAPFGQYAYGVSLTAQSKLTKTVTAFALAKYEWTQYDAANKLLEAASRGDKAGLLAVGGKWSFAKHWSANLMGLYNDHSSNLDVYQYQRYQIQTGLTYQF